MRLPPARQKAAFFQPGTMQGKISRPMKLFVNEIVSIQPIRNPYSTVVTGRMSTREALEAINHVM